MSSKHLDHSLNIAKLKDLTLTCEITLHKGTYAYNKHVQQCAWFNIPIYSAITVKEPFYCESFPMNAHFIHKL